MTVDTISTKEGHRDKTDAGEVLHMPGERGGGEAPFPGDRMTLGKAFDKLRDQIRSRYLIAHKPADFDPDGKYRTVSIVAEKNGKHLQSTPAGATTQASKRPPPSLFMRAQLCSSADVSGRARSGATVANEGR